MNDREYVSDREFQILLKAVDKVYSCMNTLNEIEEVEYDYLYHSIYETYVLIRDIYNDEINKIKDALENE
jgi:hypothetical protein